MRSKHWVALPFLVLLASCFSHSAAKDKHEAFWECPEVTSTEVETEGRTQVVTKGCGKEETFYCVGIKCRSPRLLAIRHFTADYDCDKRDVTTEHPDEQTWQVSGCGAQASYRCTDAESDLIDCTELPAGQ